MMLEVEVGIFYNYLYITIEFKIGFLLIRSNLDDNKMKQLKVLMQFNRVKPFVLA